MLINIHTHQPPASGERAIFNRYDDFEKILAGNFYSVGIHPWYIQESWLKQFKEVKDYSQLENVVAIGETGLDKLCKTDWSKQELSFTAHVQWANFLQKPLIIHCVKAWDEIFAILAREKVNVPVIFHGFSKSQELALQIIKQGYYLSFGKALEHDRMQLLLREIPLNQFFLETDDADTGIETIYNFASSALSIDRITLDLQIQKNAEAVFGPSFIL